MTKFFNKANIVFAGYDGLDLTDYTQFLEVLK